MGRLSTLFRLRERTRFRAGFDVDTDCDVAACCYIRGHKASHKPTGNSDCGASTRPASQGLVIGDATRMIVGALALAVPIFLAGCGGGAGASLTPLASSSPSIAGTSGNAGPSGSSGATTGTSSNSDNTSTSSTSGTSGSTDTTGTSGSGGNSGTTSGTTGTSGTPGTSGTSGTSGNTGTTSGTTGTSGTPGTSGTSGTSGSSGTTGTSGSGASPAPQGTVIANIQTNPTNWRSWGQVAPTFTDCSPSPCDGVSWSMQGGITSPSLSNNATQFNLGGTTPYGDVLFSPGLIGDNSKEIPDSRHTLLSTVHSLTYDVDFYVTNAAVTQALEFDLTMSMNGVGMIWGQECNHLNDGQWDIWDNVNAKWVSAGVPCAFVNGWNHLTIQVQRKADNTLVYQSIALNGTTYTLNISYPPGTAPAGWWGLSANYQMDGDHKQSPNTTYLDNFNVTYQ